MGEEEKSDSKPKDKKDANKGVMQRSLDRSDGEGFKDEDADVGKNQFLRLLGYMKEVY